MLNWIWATLIISSFVFALGYDVQDMRTDRYRNGQALPAQLTFPDGYDAAARTQNVAIRIDPAEYASFYGNDEKPDSSYAGTLVRTKQGSVLRFAADASLPEPLTRIAGVSKSNDDELQGTVSGWRWTSAQPEARVGLRFEPVHFVKLNAVGAAALDFAKTASEIALGLIGVLSLFLGLLKIAEEAGIILALVRVVRPVLRPLFPEIPEDHPALGMIALNLAANFFGLGNAATPFGIKAMEEMQKLNTTEDTATNSMVMLLAMNTASVQFMPPVLLLALMGLQINELFFAIVLTTLLSLIIGIGSAILYGKLPMYRKSDPNRLLPPAGPSPATAPSA